MKQFTAANLRALSPEIAKALEGVAKANGISIRMGRGSFNGSNATMKIELSVLSETGQVITKERAAYEELAEIYGLKKEWLDKSFTSRDGTFTITGLNTKAPRMPVLAKRSDGKGFKFGVETVVRYFEKVEGKK